jgi:hypothetical protein
MARRCLYYPFIHFRDEAWLKLSALYWDDVSRIVPGGYEPRDTREVRVLEDAGVLRRVDPSAYERSVARLFTLLLERYERKLVKRYDVADREQWPKNLERYGVNTGRVSSQSLAFIHASKLEPGLSQRLLELRLALPSRDRRWLGMHPAIVSAYMVALAREISERRGLSPISASPTFLSAVSSTPDDLARALVSEIDLRKTREPAASRRAKLDSERVAFVTLRAVLPAKLEALSAKRIIDLRNEHAGARHAFHGYVEEVRAQLSSQNIADPAAVEEHVRLEYERRLKPEMVEPAVTRGRNVSGRGRHRRDAAGRLPPRQLARRGGVIVGRRDTGLGCARPPPAGRRALAGPADAGFVLADGSAVAHAQHGSARRRKRAALFAGGMSGRRRASSELEPR